MSISIKNIMVLILLITHCATQASHQKTHRRSQSAPTLSKVEMAHLELGAEVTRQEWNAQQHARASVTAGSAPAVEQVVVGLEGLGLKSPPPSPESLVAATAATDVCMNFGISEDSLQVAEFKKDGE